MKVCKKIILFVKMFVGMGKVKSIGTFTPNIFICCQRVGRVAPKLASLYFAFHADVT